MFRKFPSPVPRIHVRKNYSPRYSPGAGRLDEILREKGVTGEVCVFGGAAMVLTFDARESTRDVDGIFVPKSEVAECARLVGEELGLEPDGVKGFVSAKGEVTSSGMPVFENLRVTRPSTEYLLAMKCLASRIGDYGQEGDRGNVVRLIKELDLQAPVEVCDLVESYYTESRVPAKVRFFIEEVFSEI